MARRTHHNKPTKQQKRTGDRRGVPADYAQATRGIRLQKAMAEAGYASRRECEEAIEAGQVYVNGELICALPAWVNPDTDVIKVNGVGLPRPPKSRSAKELRGQSITVTPHDKIVLAVHKPRRVVSTTEDPEGRRCVTDLVEARFPQRLFLVGRLDFESTGLILLTNDGELAQRLTHPSYEVAKQYLVTVKGRVEERDLERLRKGMYIASSEQIARSKHGKGVEEDGKTPVVKATLDEVRILRRDRERERGDTGQVIHQSTTLNITLREGKNREIRRLMARLGFQVRKLKRTAIGPVKIKGVAVGGWRVLTSKEVGRLRDAVGIKG